MSAHRPQEAQNIGGHKLLHKKYILKNMMTHHQYNFIKHIFCGIYNQILSSWSQQYKIVV